MKHKRRGIIFFFDSMFWAMRDFFSRCWYGRLIIESVNIKFEQEPHMFITRARALFGEEQIEFNAFCGVWACWETHEEYENIEGWQCPSGWDSRWSFEGKYVSNWYSYCKPSNFYDGFEGETTDVIVETSKIDHDNIMPVETAIQIIIMCYSYRAGLR